MEILSVSPVPFAIIGMLFSFGGLCLLAYYQINRTKEDPMGILEEVGAIIDGHFELTSKRHSGTYFEKRRLTSHPRHVEKFCRQIANHYKHSEIQVVVAPAVGAIPIGSEVARILSHLTRRDVIYLVAEKIGGVLTFDEYCIEQIHGKRALVIDDVLTTGGSISRLIEMVRDALGIAEDVGVLVNRGGVTSTKLRVNNLFAVVEVDEESFEPSECPMCKGDMPLDDQHGHGKLA